MSFQTAVHWDSDRAECPASVPAKDKKYISWAILEKIGNFHKKTAYILRSSKTVTKYKNMNMKYIIFFMEYITLDIFFKRYYFDPELDFLTTQPQSTQTVRRWHWDWDLWLSWEQSKTFRRFS